jgi:hypothetical protein
LSHPSWEILRENHGETIGKPWEIIGKSWGNYGKVTWDLVE